MTETSGKPQSAAPASHPYCVNIFPADTTGCDFYRNFAPRETIEHCVGNIMFNTCRKFMVDENFFKGVNVNILQRQVNNSQCEYYLKFIIPMSRKCGSWIVYNIDDCIHKDDIPRYNKAWEVYQNDQYMDNVYRMLNQSDFVLVTTEELGQYYVDKFRVNPDSIVVIPNFVPRWWMGQFFDIERRMRAYDKFVSKDKRPRIGLIGAPAHYDVNNKNLDNDITPVLDYIKKTVKDYQWVIFGSIIPELSEFVKSGQIEYHGGIDILHYPAAVNALNLQFVVAPLADNTFNRCKSNIKLTEAWSLGIGCAGQNLPTYAKYTDDVFGNGDELDSVLKRRLESEKSFSEMLLSNYAKMDRWWLEGNIAEWLKLYRLRQKPLLYNFDMNLSKPNGSAEIEAPKIRIPEPKKPIEEGK